VYEAEAADSAVLAPTPPSPLNANEADPAAAAMLAPTARAANENDEAPSPLWVLPPAAEGSQTDRLGRRGRRTRKIATYVATFCDSAACRNAASTRAIDIVATPFASTIGMTSRA
jgi:hypothetical protein